MLRFECDYGEGAAQPVLDLLQKTNLEQTPGYGEDAYCAAAADKIRALCDAVRGMLIEVRARAGPLGASSGGRAGALPSCEGPARLQNARGALRTAC